MLKQFTHCLNRTTLFLNQCKLQYHFSNNENKWHHTTILALKRNNHTYIIGDGQVSQGNIRVKVNGRKIRKLADGVYCGFAGSLADAFTLMEGL